MKHPTETTNNMKGKVNRVYLQLDRDQTTNSLNKRETETTCVGGGGTE